MEENNVIVNQETEKKHKKKTITCLESGKCFAKKNGLCIILSEGYKKPGMCKFRKPEQGVTNGKRYAVEYKEWGES